MATYGTPAGVQALIRHMAVDGVRAPSSEQIAGWLTEASALLTSVLADAGYTTPVTQEDAVVVLSAYANVYAASRAELAQRFAGDTGEEGNRRYEAFLAEWEKAEAWIRSGALAALGVPQTSTAGAVMTFVDATYNTTAPTDEYGRPYSWWSND